MSTDTHSSSSASTTTTSPPPSLDIPLSPVPSALPDPIPDRPGTPPPSSLITNSPPLDLHPYSPHAVGIGILSPQPILGPRTSLSSRSSLSPLQSRISPVVQRSNPLESPRTLNVNPFDAAPISFSSALADEPQIPRPPSPQIPFNSSLTGLKIDLPPTNPVTSVSTPSPPLLPPPTNEPVTNGISAHYDIDLTTPPAISSVPTDLSAASSAELDLAEIDTEGLSALEKIYLFSRSTAGFHRVFITRALSSYLAGPSSREASASSSAPSHQGENAAEEMEKISPAEAVEYVLPLLSGLAMDDDESVKEALAVELVPIIWWYITHCKLVEDDFSGAPSSPLQTAPPASQVSERPTEISVQAFTPILGTLLLSPNGLVGGPARYAVVELLRRVHRADANETSDASASGTSSSEPREPVAGPSSQKQEDKEPELQVGLLGWAERRLLEREIVHQVVIGMGRLDMVDDFDDMQQQPGSMTTPTAMQLEGDSYFPAITSSYVSPTGDEEMSLNNFSTDATAANSLSPADTPTFTFEVSSPSPLTQDTSPDPIIAGPESTPISTSSPPSTPSLVSSASTVSSLSTSTPLTPHSSRAFVDSGSPLAFPDQSLSSPQIASPTPINAALEDHDVQMTTEEWVPPHPRFTHGALTSLQPQQQLLLQQFSGQPASPGTSAPRSPGPAPQLQDQFEAMPLSPSGQVPPLEISGQAWASGDAGAAGVGEDGEDVDMDAGDLGEEAALGRLSSMSLMAAVTASGSISEDTKSAFVAEVERVGRDPVYWVRREASFAVGALAKVVPVEVVTSSLLPLFEALCQDNTWHVRQSVLFALPAILSRLSPSERERLALQTMIPLAWDESPTVRYAVLESLGEVMHTFADDEGGPPSQLLNLFLGTRSGGSALEDDDTKPTPALMYVDDSTSTKEPDIYNDPARPLVCAFNIPAVALTLGRARWPELRGLYQTLTADKSPKVRRTLAASLGELAKIVGPEHARSDLLGVWWASVQSEETEVRLKAVECMEVFVAALAKEDRATVIRGLEDEFVGGKMRGWRERVEVARALGHLVHIDGTGDDAMRRLLMAAFEDRVAAIREAAMDSIPHYVRSWKSRPELLDELFKAVLEMARSDSFRKRTMFVACEQAIILSDEGDLVLGDEAFWEALSVLSEDTIVDVRIRVARLLSIIFDKYASTNDAVMSKTLLLAGRLTQDSSQETQAFVRSIFAPGPPGPRPTLKGHSYPSQNASTFSRPPPPLQR